MCEFITVQCAGFTTYSDALIARLISGGLNAFLLSLIGTSANIRASSAIILGGDSCRISREGEPEINLQFQGSIRTCRTRKIDETVNKVMVAHPYFPNSESGIRSVVVFGPDLLAVQERAFWCFDAATSIPLKPQWKDWLWEEVFQPEKLYSFGGRELQEAYLISWSEDEILQEQILEGVSMHYLK